MAVHPAEALPPVTRYAIESMFAEELLTEVICNRETKEEKRKKYVEVMRKYNVINVINVDIDTEKEDAVLKMELTVKCGISKIKTFMGSDTVGYRYVMSLQKLREYHI